METIRDSDIDALTVGRRTPLDASERTAGPNECAPNDVAVIWIECPIDAALLAKADNITHEIGACPSKIEILAVGYGTVRGPWSWAGSSKTAGSCEGINTLQPL
jgi:hypothetical protein